MKKIASTATAVLLASSGLLFVGQAANAMPCDLPGAGCTGDSNTGYPGGVAPTPDPGKGHDPVTFCHNGMLKTTDDDGELHGHKTKKGEHVNDVFREDLGREVTEADCAVVTEPVKPPQPAPEFPEGNVDITYQCDAVPMTRTDHITYKRIDYVYDAPSNSWVKGPEQVTDGVYVFPLTDEQAQTYCGVAVTPPVQETPPAVTPDAPAPEQAAPEAPVAPAVVPAAEPAPLANLGGQVPASNVEQAAQTQAPAELAYTGFNWGMFGAAILSLLGGFGLMRLKRKLA